MTEVRQQIAMMVALLILAVGWSAPGEALRVTENLRHESVLMPSGAPETSSLALVNLAVVDDESDGLGIIVFYDDPRTKREVDYLEVYDLSGDLLLISWIDRFGICRMAADQGLLRDEDPGIDGILVLITEGTPL
jgi:hypothetical protein